MATIKSENWDGVTAPSIPTGWTVDTPLVTATTNSPTSSPNSLIHPAASANLNNVPHATFATQDGQSGNVTVSATARWASTATASTQQSIGLFARASVVAANANYGTLTYYKVQWDAAITTPTLFLYKRASATDTPLGSVVVTPADATNYRVYLILSSTTIKVMVKRLSDSFWLNSSGVFVSDPTNATIAITVTDSSITGQGYSGALFYLGGTSGGNVGVDDWLLETSPPNLTTPPATPTDTVYPVKVFYGGMPG